MPDDDKKKTLKIFFLFSARENLHICYHLKTRRNDEVNAAADAKRDEAEEINIFIALPGGTNASTKFKVVTLCPMRQQKAQHSTDHHLCCSSNDDCVKVRKS